MKIIKINLKKIGKKKVDLIVDYFRKGKIIVYPTDTIYGLGCAADNIKAIDKIYKVKKREKKKPLLILVNSLAMAKKYCCVSKGQEKFLRKAWKIPLTPSNPPNPLYQGGTLKGAEKKSPYTPRLAKAMAKRAFIKGGSRSVTVILKSRGILPKELSGNKNTLAVRLPKNDFLIKIINGVGQPIVSTSVNVSGEKSLVSVENIKEYFNPPYPPLQGGQKFPCTPFVKGGNSELPDLIINAGALKNKPSRIINMIDIKNIKVLRK